MCNYYPRSDFSCLFSPSCYSLCPYVNSNTVRATFSPCYEVILRLSVTVAQLAPTCLDEKISCSQIFTSEHLSGGITDCIYFGAE